MPIEVIMPKVDMDMASGKIATWHVAVGEMVRKGDALFDIETDKAAMEVEAVADGFLHHTSEVGLDVPIGQTVAWLYGEGEEVPRDPPAATAPKPAPEPASPEANAETPRNDPAPVGVTEQKGERRRATPRARAMARTHGLNLTDVRGSGPRGRIQATDLRASLDDVASPVSFATESGALSVTRSPGGTGTPVVLIHGFANDAASWQPIERSLAHRPLIRIDLPCHGKSPKRPLQDFKQLAAELRQTFDDLQLESAHLVGHSLGGGLALSIADTRPRKVASLTLIAPAGLGPQINGDVLDGISRASKSDSLAPWLKQLVGDQNLITDGFAAAAMATRRDSALRAAQKAMAAALFPDGTQGFDLRPALGRLQCPTRIIWGKRDAIMPWQHSLAAPGTVALHLFDELGHMPHIEAPEQIGDLIGGTL